MPVVLSDTARTLKKPLSTQRVRINWAHPLNQGLVAWWLLNESSGSTAHDIARKHDGVLSDGALWSTDSVSFATAESRINAGADPAFNFTTEDFSVYFEIAEGAEISQGVIVCRGAYGADGWYIQLGLDPTQLTFSGYVPEVGTKATTTNVGFLDAASWNRVLVTKQGTTVRMFRNGVEASYSATWSFTSIASSARNLYLGRYDADGYDFRGRMKSCAIWKSVIPPEVTIHPFGTPSSPRFI